MFHFCKSNGPTRNAEASLGHVLHGPNANAHYVLGAGFFHEHPSFCPTSNLQAQEHKTDSDTWHYATRRLFSYNGELLHIGIMHQNETMKLHEITWRAGGMSLPSYCRCGTATPWARKRPRGARMSPIDGWRPEGAKVAKVFSSKDDFRRKGGQVLPRVCDGLELPAQHLRRDKAMEYRDISWVLLN